MRPLLGFWLPFIGWRRLPAEFCIEVGLEQATRWEWWGFSIEWLNHGVMLIVKPGEEIGEAK